MFTRCGAIVDISPLGESCTSIDLVGAHRSGSDNQSRRCHGEQRRHDHSRLPGVFRDKDNPGEKNCVYGAEHARCTDSDLQREFLIASSIGEQATHHGAKQELLLAKPPILVNREHLQAI